MAAAGGGTSHARSYSSPAWPWPMTDPGGVAAYDVAVALPVDVAFSCMTRAMAAEDCEIVFVSRVFWSFYSRALQKS